MYRLHSTAVNKSQWNSAPSTQWRGERMWIIGETSPSSNVSSLGSSLARAALHRKSLPTSCICAGLMKFLRVGPVGQLFKTAPSLLPGVRVGLLKPTAHVSAVVILIPNMWYLMSPLSHLRESLPLRTWVLQTMFRNRWGIALSDSQGVIDPGAKDAKEFIREDALPNFYETTVVRDLLVWFLHDGGKWPTAGPIEKLLINSALHSLSPQESFWKQATKGCSESFQPRIVQKASRPQDPQSGKRWYCKPLTREPNGSACSMFNWKGIAIPSTGFCCDRSVCEKTTTMKHPTRTCISKPLPRSKNSTTTCPQQIDWEMIWSSLPPPGVSCRMVSYYWW